MKRVYCLYRVSTTSQVEKEDAAVQNRTPIIPQSFTRISFKELRPSQIAHALCRRKALTGCRELGLKQGRASGSRLNTVWKAWFEFVMLTVKGLSADL